VAPHGKTACFGYRRSVRGRILLLHLAFFALCIAGCDRNLEPYDPNEQPREPDLSKIFPEGAERAEQQRPDLPPAPGEPRGAPPVARDATVASSAAAPVRGRVEITPALADRVPPNAVLFVIARHGGGGPPLAVKRIADPSFPLSFAIGPEDRMIQQIPFSGPITLSARIDSDGNATSRTPGDLLGAAQSGPVEPGAEGVLIVLDTVL
jgi:hypothetical protein